MISAKLKWLAGSLLTVLAVFFSTARYSTASEPTWWKAHSETEIFVRAIASEPQAAETAANQKARSAVEEEFVKFYRATAIRDNAAVAKAYPEARIRKLFRNEIAARVTIRFTRRAEKFSKAYHRIAIDRTHLWSNLGKAVAAAHAESVADYDKVHDQILRMADMLSDGIVKQFPKKT